MVYACFDHTTLTYNWNKANCTTLWHMTKCAFLNCTLLWWQIKNETESEKFCIQYCWYTDNQYGRSKVKFYWSTAKVPWHGHQCEGWWHYLGSGVTFLSKLHSFANPQITAWNWWQVALGLLDLVQSINTKWHANATLNISRKLGLVHDNYCCWIFDSQQH